MSTFTRTDWVQDHTLHRKGERLGVRCAIEGEGLRVGLRLQWTARGFDFDLTRLAGEVLWHTPCCGAKPSLTPMPRCGDCRAELWRMPAAALTRRAVDLAYTSEAGLLWTEGPEATRAAMEPWAAGQGLDPLTAMLAAENLMGYVETVAQDLTAASLASVAFTHSVSMDGISSRSIFAQALV